MNKNIRYFSMKCNFWNGKKLELPPFAFSTIRATLCVKQVKKSTTRQPLPTFLYELKTKH